MNNKETTNNNFKKYRVTIRIHNNILYSLIKQKYKTIKEFSEKCNLSVGTIHSFLTFKHNPISQKDKKYTNAAVKIAQVLGVIPEIIFPDEFQEIEYNTISIEANRDFLELKDMRNNKLLEQFDNNEVKEIINNVLETLPARERTVVEYHFGLNGREQKTLESIADIFKVSKARVQQIESKALHRLRHPSRANILKPLIKHGS